MISERDTGVAALSYWPVLLLVRFAGAFLPLSPILGYRWIGELALACFICVAGYVAIRNREHWNLAQLSRAEFGYTHLPILLFVLWSFASVAWSTSPRASLHHSLLWASYLFFFLIIRNSVSNENFRHMSIRVVGAVLLIVSLAFFVEYVVGPPSQRRVFNERYYPFAEIMATFLPIFLAAMITAKTKWSRLALIVATLSWAVIVCTTSRTIGIAAAVGVVTFIALARVVHGRFENPARLAVAIVMLVAVTLLFQIPLGSGQHGSTITRLAGADDYSGLSTRSRILMWGLAVEGFRSSPIGGIGADNYFAAYKTLRRDFADRDPNNPVLEINEGLFPERAHNEYLQILSELGIVGALLFGWLLAGIVYLVWLAYKRKPSLLTVGALSGIVAFLIASGASSYSFRIPANGICFFFLLALAGRELFATRETAGEQPDYMIKLVPLVGVIVSIAMIAFSLVRANSIMHMSNALRTEDENVRIAEIENAIAIDPSEPMFRFYYGQWLRQSGAHDAAIAQMRIAIDNGLADSPSFFRLAAAQLEAGRQEDAGETFDESLRVYPRSVFLRTAYAAFLKRQEHLASADLQSQHAIAINEKQARSWQLAHDEGLERLVQKARVDPSYVSTFELKPESGAMALADFQRAVSRPLP